MIALFLFVSVDFYCVIRTEVPDMDTLLIEIWLVWQPTAPWRSIRFFSPVPRVPNRDAPPMEHSDCVTGPVYWVALAFSQPATRLRSNQRNSELSYQCHWNIPVASRTICQDDSRDSIDAYSDIKKMVGPALALIPRSKMAVGALSDRFNGNQRGLDPAPTRGVAFPPEVKGPWQSFASLLRDFPLGAWNRDQILNENPLLIRRMRRSYHRSRVYRKKNNDKKESSLPVNGRKTCIFFNQFPIT